MTRSSIQSQEQLGVTKRSHMEKNATKTVHIKFKRCLDKKELLREVMSIHRTKKERSKYLARTFNLYNSEAEQQVLLFVLKMYENCEVYRSSSELDR